MSSREAKVLLRCSHDDKVLSEVMGEGNLIIPVVNLQHFDSYSTNEGFSLIGSANRSKSNSLSRKKTLSFFNSKSSMDLSSANKSRSNNSLKSETTYVVEAFVLENSWPLTEKEWEVVHSYKQNKLFINTRDDASVASR